MTAWPYMPGVPAAGHVTSGGHWHPGGIPTCTKCESSRAPERIPMRATLTCLDASDACSGDVEYRTPLSGTGRAFPRCQAHWDRRLIIQDRITQRYAPNSAVPPEGFDPTYAGEEW
jgi:hypothetical protein